MRSSRLLALLLALQRTGSTTARDLAEELEVSVRTVYRDLTALQVAGVPLYTRRGAGGGVRLVDAWRSPIDGMTADEARALVVGGGPAADLGLGSVLAVARSKLRSGLPPQVRRDIDVIAERFLLDTSAWFRPEAVPESLDVLADAVWSGHRVDMRYERSGRTRARRADPLGLVQKANVWYLVARHRGAIRTYRASRITGVSLRAETFERPAGFDLGRHWEDAAADFDRDIRRVDVELLADPGSAPALRSAVPGALTVRALDVATTDPDGRLRVELRVESVDVAVEQLAAVVGVEVIEPLELRRRLRTHGERLAAVHA